MNSESAPRAALRERLIAVFAGRARRVVFVKADDDLDFGVVVDAIDSAHEANITTWRSCPAKRGADIGDEMQVRALKPTQ